ncbi:MAG: Nramp family divalent metal transporter, partial [Gammaproteobacteria bacterium]|nr:Nramp family divalent metal transporter [Gammaproteobacteria bacterium]
TVVLQEMAVRQAIVTGEGLAGLLRRALAGGIAGRAAMLLVIAAVGLGNAAYESGNIAGAALAVGSILPGTQALWALLIGAIAIALLFLPAYRQLERVLIGLVLAMSAVFLVSAVLLQPDWGAMLRGMLRPRLPSGSLLTVIALIGTTVVPYNLFLQANAAREHWAGRDDRDAALSEARLDTLFSVALGGLITVSIVTTATVSYFGNGGTFSAADLASQLEPVLGPAGRYLFAAGLFAAGLTSAVTAPLAAAFAVCGALGWSDHPQDRAFRAVAIAVIVIGTVFAASGARPISLILFAQAANGLLLPLIAVVLLWLMNQRRYLSDHVNGWRSNLLGALVVGTALGLGGNKLLSLFSG